MNSIIALFPPLAVLLPAMAGGFGYSRESAGESVSHAPSPSEASQDIGLSAAAVAPFRIVQDARLPAIEHQVRIERRVIIRISPSSAELRERMLAALPRRSSTNVYEEQRLRGCIPVDSIASVHPAQENRLLLFLHDRRVLTAALERSCNAEDFYSGFYVERSDDGQICARRDELRSRSGANCQVSELNRLVAVRD